MGSWTILPEGELGGHERVHLLEKMENDQGILAGLLGKEGLGKVMSSVSDVLSFEVFKGQVDGESSRQLGV